MLKTQLATAPKDEDSPELPRVALDGSLPRSASQGTNRVSDQLRRGDLASPTAKARRAISMQVGIQEQQPLYLEVLTKGLGEAPIPISYDHDFDALSSPRSYRVTQLRDLLTTE
jgi:hypothetical protein